MNLISIRIITNNVERLVAFYENITDLKAIRLTEDFAELQTKWATLAIGSTKTLQFFGGDEVAAAAQNRTVIIEFICENVDAEYERLANIIEPFIVQKPTAMPWGNKSLLFRDTDGNLVNFFTPINPIAIKKFEGKY
jgi:catechol 2,3-dioxygenase-like lactoylglutathione lyase family enzyme